MTKPASFPFIAIAKKHGLDYGDVLMVAQACKAVLSAHYAIYGEPHDALKRQFMQMPPPVQSMAKNGRLHPNEKPVGLLTKMMRKLPEGCILDPFMGSASCAEACIKTGRPFIGIESDPKYFEIAVRRVSELVRQGVLL